MNLEEAIKTAIEYEGKVHKAYVEAMERTTHEVGRRVFSTLCEEEKGHLAYLKDRLDEWQRDGAITVAELQTVIPSREQIAAGVERLRDKLSGAPSGKQDLELELLRKALAAEVETSEFYQRMVNTLDGDGQRLFQRFVEIETGHQAIVQAEIDFISGSGFWFDTPEFSLEKE
jgi:rubrerythrin